MIRKLHIALVAGSALAATSCTQPTYPPSEIPAVTVVPPAGDAPSSAAPEVLEAYMRDREMTSCLTNAPPRQDGKLSTLEGIRADATGRYGAVREEWAGGSQIYLPGNPGADTRANHIAHCVTRANEVTRPAVIPHSEEDPIFQPQ